MQELRFGITCSGSATASWVRNSSLVTIPMLRAVFSTIIVPIMLALLPAIEYVAKNQKAFDADERFYGSFPAIYGRILALYAETKER
jgi:hypothetical protein